MNQMLTKYNKADNKADLYNIHHIGRNVILRQVALSGKTLAHLISRLPNIRIVVSGLCPLEIQHCRICQGAMGLYLQGLVKTELCDALLPHHIF